MKTNEGIEMESQNAELPSMAFFDEETLLWRMGGDREDTKALLDAFSMESKAFIEEIRQDIERCDAFALRTHSENLHECASAVSSATIKYFAHRMQHSAERDDFDSAKRLFPLLAASLSLLDEKLREGGWLN